MESQLTSTFLVGSSPPLAALFPRASSSLPLRTRSGRSRYFPRSFMPSAQIRSGSRLPRNALRRFDNFAAISSSSSQETTSVGVPPPLPVPPPSTVVSPLFWIGIGVGISVLFSWGASTLKKYAMQQAFKTMMDQIPQQNNQFNNAAFTPGSPMPFPTGPFPIPTPYSSPTSQTSATIDVSAVKVETASVAEVKDPVINDVEAERAVKKSAFVDVSPDDVVENVPFEGSEEATISDSSTTYTADNVSANGTASNHEKNSSSSSSQSTQSPGSLLSVEALEKMMEDPTVQKMVYPYLPEEMRNPSTFKWMLQNPHYRQQLQDMINSMKGNTEWDRRMIESMNNFDLNSPELKQQFDQLGLSPEEVISKIMANPEVAMAFQNPRVQAAIMDCSQNPLSITKYQNDKEVMDVFNKISELFPGVQGYP